MSLEKSPSFVLKFSALEMNGKDRHCYAFSTFRLEIAERQLFNQDISIPLTPKAFDVIALLVENAGHLVEKEELMQTIWPDSFVEETNVTRIIHTLRKLLGEDDNGNKFIETVAKKGYRFVAKVEEISGNDADSSVSEAFVASLQTKFEPSKAEQSGIGAGHHLIQEKASRRTRLLLAVPMILALMVVAFWLVNRSWPVHSSTKASAPRSNNGQAYQLYQQGRLLLERRYDGDFQNALMDFEKAIELDPNFAAAYAGKADAGINIFWIGDLRSHDDMGQVRTAINKAIELDESSSYAHTLACRIKSTYDWDFTGADKECRRAIELDPDDPDAQRELAMDLSVLGRTDEALAAIAKAVALAPTSLNKRQRGILLYFSRRYDEAIAQLQQAEETDPEYNASRRWLMSAYEMKKDYPHALESYIRQRERVDQAGPDDVTAIRRAFDENGWPAVLRNMSDNDGSGKSGLFVAGTLAQLGEYEKAFAVLDKMVVNRRTMVIHMERDPRLDPIRNDPRFNDLLKRIGLR